MFDHGLSAIPLDDSQVGVGRRAHGRIVVGRIAQRQFFMGHEHAAGGQALVT